MLTIRIGGDVVTALVPNPPKWRETLDEHAEASFTVKDLDDALEFVRGQPVVIEVDDLWPETWDETWGDGSTVFRGWIDDVTTEVVAANGGRFHHISCSDHVFLAEKRIVADVWTDTTAGAIVRDIVDRWLSDEGVTYDGTVDNGPSVSQWVANYKQAAHVIDQLAERSNYVWRIDENRMLYFTARDKYTAPWEVTATDLRYSPRPQVRRGNDAYRNRQWMVGGQDITDPLTEEFVGDGERRTFNTGFPVAKQPTVKVNGVEQTVGARGKDQGLAQWYFSYRATEITQDRDETKLTASDELVVDYQGLFDIVTRQEIDDEVDDRRAIESTETWEDTWEDDWGAATTGLVEKVGTDTTIESRQEAFDRGTGKLRTYARPSRELRFTTARQGLRAGQVATVTLPSLDLSGAEMLVTSVNANIVPGRGVEWAVRCVDGPTDKSWVALFKELARKDNDQVLDNVSEDQILTRLFQFSRVWTQDDPQPSNPFWQVWPSDDDSADPLEPSDDGAAEPLYPAMADGEWLSHLEWSENGAPSTRLGRNVLLQRDGLGTAEVFTLAYIGSSEGNNGGVGTVAWFGSRYADETIGTGVEIVTEAIDQDKNDAEAWQIERTDTRAESPTEWWILGDAPA